MPKRLLISAAEPSGDLLAAELVAALRKEKDMEVAGIAGPKMRAAGVHPIGLVEDISVMGVAEVFSHLGAIKRARTLMKQAILKGADVLVVIDAPDFHMPLARFARARGIRVVGYVSPQIWAWRSGRAERIAAQLDTLLCLFRFEPELYTKVSPGFDARWVGHPVLDRVPARGRPDPHLFGLLPGSRLQELKRHLVPFLAAAALIREEDPQAVFRVVVPDTLRPKLGDLPAWVEPISTINGLVNARAALTKSGTVTLELAAMGIPMVVAHRVHPITYWLGRLLVRGVRHIALPNVLAEKEGRSLQVREFVQRFSPAQLAQAVVGLPVQQSIDLSGLGHGGAVGRVATAVTESWRG